MRERARFSEDILGKGGHVEQHCFPLCEGKAVYYIGVLYV